MKYKLLISFIVSFLHLNTQAQKAPQFLENYDKGWVQQTFEQLTLEEKIGQLLMPRGNQSGKKHDPEKLKKWVKENKIGGIVFFAGSPTTQAQLTNELQTLSKVPLFIGMDMEWGLAMRLDSTTRFPYQLSLGAIQGHDSLLYRMGKEVAKQAREIGIHINYAPVVDINNNPENPVINFRSFGQNKENVTSKALAYMQGMQSERLLTTAKHFPGHGNTSADSHYDLPQINHSKEYLLDNEIFPFKKLIDNGITGIMTAHLNLSELEPKQGLASTFSEKVIGELLQKELNFSGLTFTDAMDMQGAIKNYSNGEAMVKALLAGNDILETFEDVDTAIQRIKAAVEKGELSEQLINQKVLKILKAKSWVGLNHYAPIQIEGLIEKLHSPESEFLNHQMAEKSVMLLKNEKNILPITNLRKKITLLSLDAEESSPLAQMMANYAQVEEIRIPMGTSLPDSLWGNLKSDHQLIVAWHLDNIRPYAKYGIVEQSLKNFNRILEYQPIALIMGNPYSLGLMSQIREAGTLALAPQNSVYMQEALAMALFGGIGFEGKLPVKINESFFEGMGIKTEARNVLSYGVAEQVGIDSKILAQKVEEIINLGLDQKAYPGAVLEIAKQGKVIYRKAFGFHTYEQAEEAKTKRPKGLFEIGAKLDAMDLTTSMKKAILRQQQKAPTGSVQLTDLYDLASITKISTSALALMQLKSQGKFDFENTFDRYYPPYKNTNKAQLKFIDMLTHRSGLQAWIPFWKNAIDTLATFKKGIQTHPEYRNHIITRFEPKGAWQRVFKSKKAYHAAYQLTLQKNPSLWNKVVSPENITWKPNIFSNIKSTTYSIEVADHLYMNPNQVTSIRKEITDSPVNPRQGYVYSDLHYYAYPQFVPLLTGIPWETYLKNTYTAIGAHSLTYNPLRYYSLEQIVPTERDSLFRKTLIHGHVHDEGAAMLEGISGHAGLFGTANDLLTLMQMYLQKGNYNGQQFIAPEVIDYCTSYRFPEEKNHRGLAFDKLSFDKSISNGPQKASEKSYGHSGFTGTFTWIDPEEDLVYVFLSNRVYPTRNNNKISTLNIRTEIGNRIIESIRKSKEY